MADEKKQLLAFNRGVISSIGLARIDLDRIAMSAETQRNFIPRILGSMMLRPGLEFIDNTNSNQFARNLPFTFGIDDQALIELANVNMKVRIDNEVITRPTVTSTLTNGLFTAVIGTGWIDISDSLGVAFINTGTQELLVNGNGTDFGRVEQEITVISPNIDVEHALRIVIDEGPLQVKVGSVSEEDDYVSETRLDRGEHSLAFTPTGNFFITLANEREFIVHVDSCTLEAAGEMEILTPWSTADLPFLRWDQSGDVIYLACKNGDTLGLVTNAERLLRIERRGTGRSWSLAQYLPEDGPFRVQNVSGVTMTASALEGDVTITSSEPYFTQSHAIHKALIRLESSGQTVTQSIAAADLFTNEIRITGSGDAREFGIIVEGTFVATVTLQFAFSEDGPWNDQGQIFTSPISTTFNDGQDGQIIFYRIGVKSSNYTSGTVTVTLNYTGGSIQGIGRIRLFISSTVVQVQVLSDFGSIEATKDWWEGEWSFERGYPTAVGLHEGRLWWAGNDKIWGSISNAFESFDDNTTGDSGPISRNIGSGPIRVINWLMAAGRLLMGTSDTSANIAAVKMDGNNVLAARSSSFDEPLTPTNFNIKTIDSKGVFVDRTQQRLYELSFDTNSQDYKSVDLSVFAPDFNIVGITQVAVQMKPDIRIHCVRSDGTVGMLIYDRLENVICWIDIFSDGATGEVEDVAVLPGTVEDKVYYIVKRTINGGTERHLCQWALESEAIGGSLNKQADSFAVFSGSATTQPFTTELLHLQGETVVIWADGADVGTDTVTAAGALTNPLAVAASNVVAGLAYTAQFKSAKLGTITGIGLLSRKKVNRIGFIAENLHFQGLQYGPTFDDLSDLPQVTDSQVVADNTVYETYHEDNFPFGGEWEPDSRICLQAVAPRPCTILAALMEMESVEKIDQPKRRR